MTWINLIDKYPDGFGSLAFATLIAICIVVATIADAFSKRGKTTK